MSTKILTVIASSAERFLRFTFAEYIFDIQTMGTITVNRMDIS